MKTGRVSTVWIGLDERIVDSQTNRVDSEALVVSGSRTIYEAQKFAKRRLRRTESDHSQPLIGMNQVIIQKNSSDFGHFIFISRAKEVTNFSDSTPIGGT